MKFRTLGFTLFVGSLIGACGQMERPACIPPSSAKLENSEEIIIVDRSASYDVYIDASGDMIGYVNPITSRNPYKDMVEAIPDIVRRFSNSVNYFKFGEATQPINEQTFGRGGSDKFLSGT
jgi:hypothetical protein